MNLSRMYVRELGWKPSAATHEAIKQGHIIVGEQDNRLHGFLKFGGLTQPYWTIYSLATVAASRNRGIAARLVQALEAKVIDAQADGIKLKVTSDNDAAIAFYEKNGFRKILLDPVGRERQALWIMRKEVR